MSNESETQERLPGDCPISIKITSEGKELKASVLLSLPPGIEVIFNNRTCVLKSRATLQVPIDEYDSIAVPADTEVVDY